MRVGIRFSLRTFIGVVTVAAIAALFWERATQRDRALREIQSLGGVVTYGPIFPADPVDANAHADITTIDFVRPVKNSDLREILRFVARLGAVDLVFTDARFGTAGLRQLSALGNLDGLMLVGAAINVSDGKLIGQMKSLRFLGLGNCSLDRGALEPLVGLSSLESLAIGGCEFSKADALALVKQLPNIRVVSIDGANVFHVDDGSN